MWPSRPSLVILSAVVVVLGAAPLGRAQTRKPASPGPSQLAPGAPVLALPDLVVESVKGVQLGPCQPNGTRQWTIQVAIRNIGAGPAFKKEAKYAWVRAQAVVDGVPLNKSSSAAGNTVGPGQAVPFSLTLTVKGGPATSNPAAKEEGSVLVMVDPDARIKEVDENNNTRTQKWYSGTACAK
jgi:hypothetical protein